MRAVILATRIAPGPKSTPAMLCPKWSGTPRMLTRFPSPGSSRPCFQTGFSIILLTITFSRPLLIPFKRDFRDRSVGIGAIVNRLDHKAHPTGFDRSHIDLLTLHAVRESKFTRTAVGKVSSQTFNPIILSPDLRTLEIAGLNQNPMQIYLAVKVESNPLAQPRPIHAFNPRRTALAIDGVRRIVGIGLDCETHLRCAGINFLEYAGLG